MKNMLYGAALALALLVVGACVSSPAKPEHLTIHQRYELACVDSGIAFGVIKAVNDVKPLKAIQQKQATDAYTLTAKRCKLAPGEDYPYTATDAVMDELESSAATLKKIQGEVK